MIGPDLSDIPDIGPDELAAIRLHTSSHISHFGGEVGVLWTDSNLKSLNLAKLSWGGGGVLCTNSNPKSLNLANFSFSGGGPLDQLKSKVPQSVFIFFVGSGYIGPGHT